MRILLLPMLALLGALPPAAWTAEAAVVRRDSPLVLYQAEYVVSDSAVPPEVDAHWQPVTLPDNWRLHDRYRQGLSAWYRFRLPDRPPEEPHSVYLWRFSMNAEAWFNDRRIGSGGSFDEPVARNWNRPFLWSVPRVGWRSENNWLYVRLRVYPGFGNLLPPLFGATEVLQPAYEERFFRQITLSQGSMVLTLLLALVGLAFWIADRRNSTYLYFTLTALTWTTYSLNLFVQHIPVSAGLWWWLVHSSIDLFALCIVLFAHRLVGVSRPALERALMVFTATTVLLYAWWDLPQLARWNNLMHVLACVGPAYVALWLVRRVYLLREPDATVLLVALLIMLGFAAHDLTLNSMAAPDLWILRSYVTQFAAPVMLLVLVVHLARRLSLALRAARSANDELEARVARATESLAAGYARRERLEAERAASAERERIYQDLHDDVGAKLLSVIYASGDSPQAKLAREALNEMRSIVATNSSSSAVFADRVANWRSETERRAEEARFSLVWDESIGDVEPSLLLCYHLERMLRELVSNALQHSRGSEIRIALACRESCIDLTVEDDGSGFEITESPSHHGLLGIRRRAARIGGEVSWYRTARGGSGTRLRVPLPPIGG